MPFEWTVALRFLREGRFQTVLIVVGVTIGVAVVVFITALVEGLQGNIINKTLGGQAQVVLSAPDDINRRVQTGPVLAEVLKRTVREDTLSGWQRTLTTVRRTPGVTAAAAIASGGGFALRGGVRKPVALTGVELDDYRRVVEIDDKLVAGRMALAAGDVLIGTGLASDLGLRPGDTLRLLGTVAEPDNFRVSGVLDFGAKPLNDRQVYLPLRRAQSLLDFQLDVSEIQIRTADLFAADRVARRLAAETGLKSESWMETNAQLLSALSSQRMSTGMIRTFVAITVALGIASVLAVSVVQKSREIGILRAMGTPARRILYVFLIQGGLVGLTGSVGGALLGGALGQLFMKIAHTPDGLPMFPIELTPALFLQTALLATVVGVLAAAFPALRAARLDPVQAIRYG